MRKDYERLFTEISQLEPPSGLMPAILARIDNGKRQAARLRVLLLSVSSLVSVFALITALIYLTGDFNQSGFNQYFSLLFTDSGAAITYWREISMSLLESLPIMSTAAVFATIFVLLISLKLLAQNAKEAFLPIHLT